MTFMLDQDRLESGLDPLTRLPSGFGETFSAGVDAARIEMDSQSRSISDTARYIAELRDDLGDAYGEGPSFTIGSDDRIQRNQIEYVTNRISTLRENDADGRYESLPATVEEFQDIVTGRRKAIYGEQQEVLDNGSSVAGIFGALWAGVTDETTLMSLPFGAGVATTGRIGAAAAVEAGVSVGAEALTLPRQFEVADELDLPDPNVALQLGVAAGIGGALGGAMAGAQRYVGYRRERASGGAAARPEGENAVDFESDINAAREDLDRDRVPAVPEPVSPPAEAFRQVLEAGSGYTIVAGPDGQPLRREGTRAWRNHNPGNIEFGPFAKRHGAIGTDGRFAVFPTYEAGRAAKAALLFETGSYRNKTIRQAINRYAPPVENDSAGYAATIARAAGVSVDTRMSRLTPAQRELLLDAMEYVEGFKPGTENGVPASSVRGRSLGAGGADTAAPSFDGYVDRRGYTSTGQVTAGDDIRVDVEYQVVDVASLTRASGDLQPRDRSRRSSDEQIAEIATRLDPARLMPSPEADRGSPIVGPDNVIESGNGRVMAIQRAYEQNPNRADAYRQQIEAAGYPVPEGVERPVLVARRTSELDADGRRRFVKAANSSAVARMSATERAASDARSIDADTLGLFDPAQPLGSAANAGFVRRALDAMPQAERSGLVDADGVLNDEGQRRIRQAMFARAFDAPDILARYAESGAGELRSLMDALEQVAPAWAGLRAAVADGRMKPEFDVTPHLADAMRIIAEARIVARQGGKPAQILDELLADEDLFEGAVAPLTAAFARRFYHKGRAQPAEKVAALLQRYAAEARRVGEAEPGLFGEGPGPLDALKAIEPETFGRLDTIGPARVVQPVPPAEPVDLPEDAFADGAMSEEAIAADARLEDEILPAPANVDAAVDDVAMDAALEEFADFEMSLGDGVTVSAREMLEDLDAEDALQRAIDGCPIGGTANG